MSKKKTTVSLANTPVQRALSRSKRSTLIILFVVGIVGGLLVKGFLGYNPITESPSDGRPQQQQEQP